MGKRWHIIPHDMDRVAAFARSVGVPAVVAQLLLGRGLNHPGSARQFLDANLMHLRDPNLLPGLGAAADRIWDAVGRGHRITVYGDYDADGMTGTAILLRCLALLGAAVDFYVPHRLDEGYGLNREALQKIACSGSQLVVTVDCGIASVQEAEAARELKLDLIITDHHQCADRLPEATVVVHPQLPGHAYPFDGLCGAGVAFKLAWALCQRASGSQKVRPRFREFLLAATGLAAIGTIADVVPLVDENRLLVKHGLLSLKGSPLPGIAALARVAKLDDRPQLASEDVAFALAPRLNAAGRLGQAELAVELLRTDSHERANELAGFLDELNSSRDHLERSIYLAATRQLKESPPTRKDPALVLAGRGWHAGVIGIVAGRLAERFCRPVVLIALDELGGAIGTGSARSAFGLDLYHALRACSDHLVSFGGHAAAAGLRIDVSSISAFRQEFCNHVASRVEPEDRVAELRIDAESPLAQLTLRTVEQIEQLAPFGHGNPRPVLCATEVQMDGPPRRMGSGDRHLALKVRQHNVCLRGVAFGRGEWAEDLERHSRPIDIAYRPVINEFRGRRRVEVHIVDWRPTNAPVPLA